MKKIILNGLFASALALSSMAVAQGKKAAPAPAPAAGANYRLPAWGMAGCGLGTLVFAGPKSNTMGTQLLVLTTNDSVSPQTSAITSGTSNCNANPASAEAMRIERETYVAVNLTDISKEASQGNGTHLQSLADILGCGDQQNFSTFAQLAQTSHSEIFSDAVPENVTERLLSKANASEDLRSCLRDN